MVIPPIEIHCANESKGLANYVTVVAASLGAIISFGASSFNTWLTHKLSNKADAQTRREHRIEQLLEAVGELRDDFAFSIRVFAERIPIVQMTPPDFESLYGKSRTR